MSTQFLKMKAKTQFGKKMIVYQEMVLTNLGFCPKKVKLDLYLSSYTKDSSKWIKGLNSKHETFRKIHKGYPSRYCEKQCLFKLNTNGIGTNPSISRWDYMRAKCFCRAKEIIIRTDSPWEKIFTNYTLDKGIISRSYRELKKLNTKEKTPPSNKWANELNVVFKTKTNKHKKKLTKHFS